MGSYIMYHCHSEYSLLDSCTNYKDYVQLAAENGQRALSISEHGKPLNWTEKWAACKDAGIRYIHSVEIYLTETLDEKVRDNYHTVLMARNADGVKELNKLVELSCRDDHFYYVNRITFDEFISTSSNIISTSACLASPLNRLPKDHPRYMELARKYDFLEVQAHNHPDQVDFNKRLLELSREIGTPLIAGTDTHSSTPYKAECRAILLKSKHKTYGDEDSFDLTYKTYDELVDMFKAQGALPEVEYMRAIENTNLLLDMTEDIDLDLSIKYPILYGSREEDERQFILTLQRKFKDKLDRGVISQEQEQAFRDAMNEEIRVFRKLGMMGFMLSMSELVSWCKDQGMAIGTARGSVGGSRVAYVADIIDLNPETWHTVFSRFANEDRTEIGDIDIDCVESDRPAIFEHIITRFGKRKTARVASFGTMQEKGVIDDVGRALAMYWTEEHEGEPAEANPWSLQSIARIKNEYEADPDVAKDRYPQLFRYFDGLLGTKISQSVHPAGMVISPITLDDNYGVFNKDGETCLLLDMENIHDYTGLAKYDLLVLKTVQVIRDACRYIGTEYPKTHEIDWNDQDVWSSMLDSPVALFQMEGSYAFECMKKFRPKSIFDLSLVTAGIRPSGASYRDNLLARRPHKNPSPMIDELLADNLGYLVYQEDTIRFLQNICGLSGSDADNIRRAIGRKQKDRLDKAMPDILEGYCSKSEQARDVAEAEAREFLQIIEDSANYQFGYNHSIAYCLLTYLCAYYRHYYPLEFVTAFLNNAANEDDIRNGTLYANKVGIVITMPKWGKSKSEYYFDRDSNTISKGLSSIKYMSDNAATELYDLAISKEYRRFVDVLYALNDTTLNSRQLDILIRIDYFSEFGNQRELLRITELFADMFKRGEAKQVSRERVAGTPLEEIVKRHAVCHTKSGEPAKNLRLVDTYAILCEAEDVLKSSGLSDVNVIDKVRHFAEVMGYAGFVSGQEEDRRKLYVQDVFPLKRRSDGRKFAYIITTKSIGSGVESRFTVFSNVYNASPIKKGDVIRLGAWDRDPKYPGSFTMHGYVKLNND